MSADLWLEYLVPGDEEPTPLHDWENITYNLTPMLREAGYPGHREMSGAPATEAGGVFRKVADTLAADPERFRAMNPLNGWGDYEGAMDWCRRMARNCALYPHGHIGTCL